MDAVNHGMLKAADKLYELKALKEQEKMLEVLSVETKKNGC